MLYFVFLVLNALEMLWEVRISVRNSRNLVERGAIEIAPRILPMMASLYAAMYVGSLLEFFFQPKRIPLAWAIVFAIFFLLSKALKFWAVNSLGKFWTMKVLVLPESHAVTGGPYRYLRHPNYVAVMIEIAATTLLGKCFITFAVVFSLFALVLVFRIKAEEQALRKYTDYK